MAAIKYLNSLDRIQIISPRDPTGTYLLIFCRFRRFFRSWQHVNSSCPVPAWGGSQSLFGLYSANFSLVIVQRISNLPVFFFRSALNLDIVSDGTDVSNLFNSNVFRSRRVLLRWRVFRSLRYPSHATSLANLSDPLPPSFILSPGFLGSPP